MNNKITEAFTHKPPDVSNFLKIILFRLFFLQEK